jgi:hypothetical protein
MSERNGDRARFQKNRKRKLLHRQRIQALVAGLRKTTEHAAVTADRNVTATFTDAAARATSPAVHDEAGPARTGD